MRMILALKSSVRSQPRAIFSRNLFHPRRGFKASAMTFTSTSDAPEMDTAQELPKEATNEDIMSHSFGEGYSTRSDEEGFGGIYGGNDDTALRMKEKREARERHPEYDKSQGSEVKEKEKGRHQAKADK